jgi:uncharacterized metal-binding protein
MQCSKCEILACSHDELEKAPQGCPTIDHADAFGSAKKEYEKSDIRKMHQAAAHIEATGYMKWPRLLELIKFAQKMGYKKLGIAFCIGLKEEAKTITRILEKNDFQVFTAICTQGSLKKREIDIPHEDTFTGADEVSCNPIGQAYYLNAMHTDLNLIVGLCIGHDINFMQHSNAPVTVLIVKDRVTTHNPAAVIYSRYYKKYLFELPGID